MIFDEINFIFKEIAKGTYRVTLRYAGGNVPRSFETEFVCSEGDVAAAFADHVLKSVRLGTFEEWCRAEGHDGALRASIAEYQRVVGLREDLRHLLGKRYQDVAALAEIS